MIEQKTEKEVYILINKNINFRKILFPAISILLLLIIIFMFWYSQFYKHMQNQLKFQSQYTFGISINSKGEVVDKEEKQTNEVIQTSIVDSIPVEVIAEDWIKEYLEQYTRMFVAKNMAVSSIKIDNIEVLSDKDKIVLISFSVKPRNEASEYFDGWYGIRSDGRLICEWVVDFFCEDQYDGTMWVSTKSVELPEGSNMSKYYTANGGSQDSEDANKVSECDYQILNQNLDVTYNGGTDWITVPVDYDKFTLGKTLKNGLNKGSYCISKTKTAFIYGGGASSTSIVSLTIIYSDDAGNSWTTAEVDTFTGINYYYVNYFDKKNGCIFITYENSSGGESSCLLTTSDGGENWQRVNSGPLDKKVNGYIMINQNIGFVSYVYSKDIISNLYMTKDGGKTYNAVEVPDGDFATTSKYQWSEIFVDKGVPTFDSGVLNVIIKQSSDKLYKSGTVAARYVSKDLGETWEFSAEIANANGVE